MLKKNLAIASVFGILALMGAGCNNNTTGNQNTSPTNTGGNNTTTLPNDSETTTPSENSAFNVKVNTLGNGRVKVEWTVPEDVDQASRIRVMHASRPDSNQPFWFNFPLSVTSTERTMPTGTRYISVCEFKDNACVRTSTEVEINVE